MYVFLFRPRWILSHLLVGALVASMVLLGFWQLDRLDSRQARNTEITSRLIEAPVEITSLVVLGDGYGVGPDVRFRLATASGSYAPGDEVLILNRSLNGSPGYWVLTPLMLDDDTAVMVNRGWVPFVPGPGEPRPQSAALTGRVAVQGLIRQTVTASGIQSADPADGVLDALARPDLARIAQQVDYEILPVYLQLEVQEPQAQQLPLTLPRPALDDGPHLAYAVQWFIFTMIALVGYPLVLRRIAQSDGTDGRHSDIPVDYL